MYYLVVESSNIQCQVNRRKTYVGIRIHAWNRRRNKVGYLDKHPPHGVSFRLTTTFASHVHRVRQHRTFAFRHAPSGRRRRQEYHVSAFVCSHRRPSWVTKMFNWLQIQIYYIRLLLTMLILN